MSQIQALGEMGEAKRRGPHRRALPLHSTVKCSDRLSAEIIFDRDGMRVLWSPPPPFPFKVTDEEPAAYRRARNDLMQETRAPPATPS